MTTLEIRKRLLELYKESDNMLYMAGEIREEFETDPPTCECAIRYWYIKFKNGDEDITDPENKEPVCEEPTTFCLVTLYTTFFVIVAYSFATIIFFDYW